MHPDSSFFLDCRVVVAGGASAQASSPRLLLLKLQFQSPVLSPFARTRTAALLNRRPTKPPRRLKSSRPSPTPVRPSDRSVPQPPPPPFAGIVRNKEPPSPAPLLFFFSLLLLRPPFTCCRAASTRKSSGGQIRGVVPAFRHMEAKAGEKRCTNVEKAKRGEKSAGRGRSLDRLGPR